MNKKTIAGVCLAGVVSSIAAFVAGHEGVENTAYVDPVGVVTVCAGHTRTARLGQTLSDADCKRLLEGDLRDAFDALDRTVQVTLSAGELKAYSSLIFNVGAGNWRKSTLLRYLNQGNRKEACDQLMRWIYAGGRVLPGLVLRRADERTICLDGAGYGYVSSFE